jgi:FkbM family methyltransferase
MKYNHPGAKIVGYEPFRQSYEIIEKNIKDNNFKNVTIHNYGVLDKACIIPFYHHAGGAGLGDSIERASDSDSKEFCQFENIDDEWLHVKKIDLCKIDIEGSEFPVLDNCSF